MMSMHTFICNDGVEWNGKRDTQPSTDCLSDSTSPQSFLFVILVSPDTAHHYKMRILAMKFLLPR